MAALVVSLVLLLVGARRQHKVYEAETGEVGLLTVHRISDRQLVVDATFTGVERRGRRLYSVYDRSQPQGKRSCPT